MTLNNIIEEVAAKLNLPKSLVYKTYKAYWKAIKEHITSLPLKEDLTDQEFMNLQPNVNIPSLGKLYITIDGYKSVQHYYKISLNLKDKKDVTHN